MWEEEPFVRRSRKLGYGNEVLYMKHIKLRGARHALDKVNILIFQKVSVKIDA